MTRTSVGATVFLAPPSPPFVPHLGTMYTWCLLDAAARAARRAGSNVVLPESWNLSSRRRDSQLAGSEQHQRDRLDREAADAIGKARALLSDFGVAMSADPPVRDDDPAVRSIVRQTVSGLAASGTIRRMPVAEKWCDPCQIAMPAAAAPLGCFRCGLPLVVHERSDWFLALDLPAVFDLAARCQWLPPYAERRFRALSGISPQVRVGHFGRVTGIPSPFDERQILDPRLVAALYPRMLRTLGYDRIMTAAGQDIQRKWLVLVFGTGTSELPVDMVINHGVLLADGRRKMSRYNGATISDLPHQADPAAFRAGLLAASLGRDITASAVAFQDASRLRAKVVNTIRFLQAQPPSRSASAISLDAELGPLLDKADTLLAELSLAAAYQVFRRCVRAELSHRLIPQIRDQGCCDVTRTVERLLSVAAVFYGDTELRVPG